MKKLLLLAMAIVVVATLAVGVTLASGTSTQGVPSAKTSVGYSDVDFTNTPNQWVNVPGLDNIIIKTSNASSLVISLTAEADLITDVQLKGTNQSSTSWAGIQVRALVDGNTATPAIPGNVTLNYRLMTLSGTLWGNSTSLLFAGLPNQYIDIYEHTRSANGFNFYVPQVNVGSGVHTITIQAYIDTGSSGLPANASAGAIIGKRTCIVEADRLN